MLSDIRSVALSEIDSATDAFRISTHTDLTSLSLSIGRFGVINPPILLRDEHGTYQIVSGFARVAAAGLLDRETITARILPETVSRAECVQIAIVENTSLRSLNPLEQARCVALLSTITENADHLVAAAREMGLHINKKMASVLARVIQMPSCLHRGLTGGSIALPVALLISQMEDTLCIEMLSAFLIDLNLSLNRQRELFDWIEALAHLENQSVSRVLSDPDLIPLLQDPDLDRKQKITAVRLYFRKRRYPNIVNAEQRYETCHRKLKLPHGVVLIPPPYFESDTYSLRIDFKTIAELKQIRSDLDTIIDSDTFSNLLKH